MGIFTKLFGNGGSTEQAYQDKLYLVDASGLYEGRKDQKLAPRDQIEILQKLSHISTNEGIAIHAFFEGEPLRKVEHGGKFDDITVFFCAEAKQLPDAIIAHMQDWIRRKTITVITSDRRLEERVLVDGALTMRISTFKKAFEKTMGARRRRRQARKGGGKGGEDGGGKSEGKPQGGGRSRDRRPRGKGGNGGGGGGGGQSEQDGVNALIDLVE